MATQVQPVRSPARQLISVLQGGRYNDRNDFVRAVGNAANRNWKRFGLSTYFDPVAFADLSLHMGWVKEVDGQFQVVADA